MFMQMEPPVPYNTWVVWFVQEISMQDLWMQKCLWCNFMIPKLPSIMSSEDYEWSCDSYEDFIHAISIHAKKLGSLIRK